VETVVLGLGSNKGDSLKILQGAIKELDEILVGLRAASLYITEPMHIKEQDMFYNTAVSGFYGGSPHSLLQKINKIEEKFGRNRACEERWGARTLDIDILLFGDRIINDAPCGERSTCGESAPVVESTPCGESALGVESPLIVPHPRLAGRCFALIPLLEIMPDAVEPQTGEYYKDILAKLPDQGVVMFKGGGTAA